MNWNCVSCGRPAKTNRQKCPRCGSMLWKPVRKKDLIELAGPIKRIAPKGLMLSNPGKQAPNQDSDSIECGKCQTVIYKADDGFDANAFDEAKRKHYSSSPTCKEQE